MMKITEAVRVKVGDLPARICAWRGCTNSCKGETPAGWVNLSTWWSWPEPDATIAEAASSPFCKRDAVLCPQHAAELERLLKNIGGDLNRPVGSA
jgi:hypothetical protein